MKVIGENPAAAALREHLRGLGYSLTAFGAPYVVEFAEHASRKILAQTGEGSLGPEAARLIGELTKMPVEWLSSVDLPAQHIVVRYHESACEAAELGVLRALLNATGHGAPPAAPANPAAVGWLKRIFQ